MRRLTCTSGVGGFGGFGRLSQSRDQIGVHVRQARDASSLFDLIDHAMQLVSHGHLLLVGES